MNSHAALIPGMGIPKGDRNENFTIVSTERYPGLYSYRVHYAIITTQNPNRRQADGFR